MKKLIVLTLVLVTPIIAHSKDRLALSQTINDVQYYKCSEVRITKALFFKILDLGLYAPDCKSFSGIFSKQSKLIQFSYLRTVTGKEFKEGAEEYLAKNISKAQLESCKIEYDLLNSQYLKVNKGDTYRVVQTADNQLVVSLNSQLIGKILKSQCAVNYLNVWFGEKVMDSGFNQLVHKALANANPS